MSNLSREPGEMAKPDPGQARVDVAFDVTFSEAFDAVSRVVLSA